MTYPTSGLAPQGALRAIGTAIDRRPGGVRAIRRRISELPDLRSALTWLITEVARERRADIDTHVRDLRMAHDGRLIHGRRDQQFLPTPRALGQLMNLLDAPAYAGSYLVDVPPLRRAAEINAILAANQHRDRSLVLRARNTTDDIGTIFSVVTERYTPVDPDMIARQLLRCSQHDADLANARAEVIFTGERTSLRLYRDSDVASTDLAAGETFAAVLGLRLSDDKSWGQKVSLEALRSLCLNLSLVKADRSGLYSGRHIGDPELLTGSIVTALRTGADLLPSFLEAYRAAANVTVTDPHLVIRFLTGALTQRKTQAVVQLPGVKPQQLVDSVLQAWEVEHDSTQAGISNAITRAAHAFPWPSIWSGRDLERQGSLLLATPEPRFRKLIEIPTAA